MILTNAYKDPDAPVTGEVPTAKRPGEHIADVAGTGGVQNSNREPKRPKKQIAKHFDPDGKNDVNRRGSKLCHGFQDGTCTTNPCPKGFSHQCSVCMKPGHGAFQHKDDSPRKRKGTKGSGKTPSSQN